LNKLKNREKILLKFQHETESKVVLNV